MWPFSRNKQEEQRGLENPSVGLGDAEAWAETFSGELSGAAGETVNRETALSVPAVWAAVNALSSAIANLPFHAYQRSGDDRERLTGRAIDRLISTAPNPRWTSFRWRKYMMQSVLLSGRAYTWIDRPQAGVVRALWPLDPEAVTPRWDSANNEILYDYRPDQGQPQTYRERDMIDVPWMLDFDGINHISPLSKLKRAVGLTIALERYATNFFESGGVPPLQMTGPIRSAGAAQRASEEIWQRLMRRRNRNVLVMPDGHELKQIGYNPDQSQLTDARRFQVEEVARVYDIPVIMLQDLTHGTYSNTEQQDLAFVKHSLAQWVSAIEQQCNLKLFSQSSDRFVEMNVDGLLRGDFETRMNGYAQGIQNSVYTPNEVRRKENLPPREVGNDLMIQQNMSELNNLGNEGEAE